MARCVCELVKEDDMSVSMWSYRQGVCDGGGCPGDCDLCDKPKNMEDEPSDYISRQAAIEAVEKCQQYKVSKEDYAVDFAEVKTELMMLPTADVRENVRATKVISGGSANSKGTTLWFICSECKMPVDITDNFCKHCGADMRHIGEHDRRK